MLYIVLKGHGNGLGHSMTSRPTEYTWHVGQRLPDGIEIDRITEVQADGDELEHVIQRSQNLPTSFESDCAINKRPSRVQRWFGDAAKWIVANIVL